MAIKSNLRLKGIQVSRLLEKNENKFKEAEVVCFRTVIIRVGHKKHKVTHNTGWLNQYSIYTHIEEGGGG